LGGSARRRSPARRAPIRRRLTGPTRTIVAGKLAEAKDALNLGLDMPDNRTTIAEFARWWEREVLPLVNGLSRGARRLTAQQPE
jgi:hypothetical protein